MPSRLTLCAAIPSIRWPLNQSSPVCSFSAPEIRLTNVVLPAPFGPISLMMVPGWISSVTSALIAEADFVVGAKRQHAKLWHRPERTDDSSGRVMTSGFAGAAEREDQTAANLSQFPGGGDGDDGGRQRTLLLRNAAAADRTVAAWVLNLLMKG